MKNAWALIISFVILFSFAGCDSSSPSLQPTPSDSPAASDTLPAETPTAALTIAPTETPSPTPTPEPTPSPEPTDAPDSAGQGSLVFDIYQTSAERDVNFDGNAETITFTSGADKSTLAIDGKSYDVAEPALAQLFAITDIDTSDKTMEFVFTDPYNPDLADSEKLYSWLYWWDGSKLILMGGLMDVKFAGDWRTSFMAADVIDGKGQVSCLARTQELTDIWYIANYKTTGTGRKLYEWRHTATPVNEVGELTCKTVCLLQTNHDETGRDKNKYMSSQYDFYWIPTLPPTTLGRVKDPEEGIKIIVQPGEKITIIGTYGPTWFKVKTHDGIIGWIYCKDGNVGAYNATKGWTADDMFDGLVVAG